MRRRGHAFLILVLLILTGIVLFQVCHCLAGFQISSWAIEETPVSAVPTPTRSFGGFCRLTYPGLVLPGPPPPGTILVRLEIPKIEFSEAVFPVGFERQEGEVVMEESAQDSVWTLDLSDPLVQKYGWGGRNYVVWAHRDPWGSRWPEFRLGDEILFITVKCAKRKLYEVCYTVSYQAMVFSWAIVPVEPPEAETQFYQDSGEPMLTLVTCHPEGDPDPQLRLVIRARFPDKLR